MVDLCDKNSPIFDTMAEDITENWQLAMTSLYSSKKNDFMLKITIDLSESRGSIVV
jgi:hypothetical protein